MVKPRRRTPRSKTSGRKANASCHQHIELPPPLAQALAEPGLQVPVALSATHVHLTSAAIEALFCDHYRLHEQVRLVQPKLYEAVETVTLVGPRGRLANVQIIGPPRSENQIEVSSTDALTLGIAPPTRRSGDVAGTPGILIKGPRGSLRLKHGVIRALRHIHMTPADSERAGVKDGDLLDAVVSGRRPPIMLRDVLVRVSPDCRLEMQLDIDEARAADLHFGDHVELLDRGSRGRPSSSPR